MGNAEKNKKKKLKKQRAKKEEEKTKRTQEDAKSNDDQIKDVEEKEEQPTNDDTNDTEDNNEQDIVTQTTFKELGVCDAIVEACDNLGWKSATRIQEKVLKDALSGRDVIGLAETGSGKTGAFCIPMLQALLENPIRGAVFGVVLAPTRELAFQIHTVVEGLGTTMGATSLCIVGGVPMMQQSIALGRNPHILVATPGRLLDHLTNTKGFNLRNLQYLVLDEADRMLAGTLVEEVRP